MSDGKFTENSQVIYYYYPVLVTLQRFKLLLYTYLYTWFWIVKYVIMLDRNRQNTKNSITPSFYMFYRISYLIARGFDNFASRSVLLLTEKNQMKKSDHNFFSSYYLSWCLYSERGLDRRKISEAQWFRLSQKLQIKLFYLNYLLEKFVCTSASPYASFALRCKGYL